MKVSLQDVYSALSVIHSLVGGEAQRVGIAAHKPESHRERWAVEEENPDFTMGTTVTFDSGAFGAVAAQAAAYLRGFDPNDPETLCDIAAMAAAVLRFAEEQNSRQVVSDNLASFSWDWCIRALKKVGGKAPAQCWDRPRLPSRSNSGLGERRHRLSDLIEDGGDDSPRPWELN